MASRKSPYSLRFIIVGGSIAGLACAYALCEAGHRVLVLEQNDGKYRSTGGIRSPPNMTRVLEQWGFGPALAKVSVKASQFMFKDGETGEDLGLLVMHDKLVKALQADFLFIQHGDLHSMLFESASKAGALIRYESKVVEVDPWTATVALQTGAKFRGDVIIGAGGYKSIVRTVVTDVPSPRNEYERMSINLMVPTELMRDDEKLKPLTELPEWTMWLCDGWSMHGVPTRNKEQYGVVLHVPKHILADLPIDEDWNSQYPIDDLLPRLGKLEPSLYKLVTMAKTFTPTKFVLREPFETWVHESGRLVVVGEAAHPLIPNGSHNASMSIEDAMILSSLFSLPLTPAQTPLLLSAYEELRQSRTAATQASELQKRDFISLAHGPEQRARDEGLRKARGSALLDWDEADEEYLRATWDEYLNVFAYDAREDVEDWWTKWGASMRRHSVGVSDMGGLDMQTINSLRYEVSTYEISTMVAREGTPV